MRVKISIYKACADFELLQAYLVKGGMIELPRSVVRNDLAGKSAMPPRN